MLYIVGTEIVGTTKRAVELGWHIGEPVPPLAGIDVTEIQADSDELVYLVSLFTNLPHACGKRYSVRWFGDMAKFIAHNLARV